MGRKKTLNFSGPGVAERGLTCPACGLPLTDAGASARCERGHSFDYARSGYLNLTGGRRGRVGDAPEMVRAREEFLASDHYAPIAAAVAKQAEVVVGCRPEGDRNQPVPGGRAVVAEVGCGTAYYLGAVVGSLGEARAFGFDLSKTAIDRAAKTHPGVRFAVADVEAAIPLADGAVDVAISVFAPRPAAELARVVRTGGALIVAFAGPRHLRALRERLSLIGVGEDKQQRLRERLEPNFSLDAAELVEFEANFTAAEAANLVAMGPNARHRSPADEPPGELTDLVSVEIARFERGR